MKKGILVFSCSGLLVLACQKAKPPTAGKPAPNVVAESCPDVDAQSARLRCNGNSLEFCSAFSKFKWTEAQQCAAGKTCFVAPDGKGGGCR